MSPEARKRYHRRRKYAALEAFKWLAYAAMVIYGASVFATWVHGV